MTPTQIARRSDALYADGTCGMTRRVLCDMVANLESDNAELREQMDWLASSLRNDWQIEASWDGLRRVWHIGWTDEHVENCAECAKGLGAYADSLCDPLKAENAKLRELVRDMWGTMGLLDACAVDEYDEPLNCCTVCNQYGRVDDLAGGKRVIGCKLVYRMCDLGVDE